MGEMESFALNLLHSASCAHVYHWQTTSYSAHKALGKFYGTMPDLVDGLVETYMGRNGIFGEVDKEQEV
jgi:predicted RecB family nuclease